MSDVIVRPVHTCGGMPGCTACLVELHARVAAAEKRAEEAERKVAEADESLQTVAGVVTGMGADLAAANAEIERLLDVGSVPERVKAHQELDACLDEAGRAEYGWLHDHDLSHQTDRIYRHVHTLAVRSFAELKSKSLADRVKRFRETVGALHGGNRNPDRCICQTRETGRYADTPHVHYQEPPFSCGRCECQAYVPAVTSPEKGECS